MAAANKNINFLPNLVLP